MSSRRSSGGSGRSGGPATNSHTGRLQPGAENEGVTSRTDKTLGQPREYHYNMIPLDSAGHTTGEISTGHTSGDVSRGPTAGHVSTGHTTDAVNPTVNGSVGTMSTAREDSNQENITENTDQDDSILDDPPSEGSDLTDDSTSCSSIAVDLAAGPSEVVVHGRNVSKIRVKFPPQPPLERKSRGRKLQSARRSRRSQTQPNTRESLPHEDEDLPFPKLVSDANIGVPQSQVSQRFPALDLRSSNMTTQQSRDYSIYSGQTCSSRNQCSSFADSHLSELGMTLVPMSSNTDVEVDNRMRDGILNGLDYFQKRNHELREVKNKVVHELDRVMKVNQDLQQRIQEVVKRSDGVHLENEELKGKMDQIEKENIRLQDQALSEWTSRIKAEELFIELQAHSQRELKSVRVDLDSKEEELEALRSSHGNYTKMSNKEGGDLQELQVELFTKIEALKEDVKRLTTENDQVRETHRKMADEQDNLKRYVAERNAELERQFNRFLSLKKSFNDVVEENERLKLRGRDNLNNTANNTWPVQGNPISKNVERLHVGLVELPPAMATRPSKSTAPPPLTKPIANRRQLVSKGTSYRQTRPGQDSRQGPDNLPPVTKDSRRS